MDIAARNLEAFALLKDLQGTMGKHIYHLLVIGGGINGTGVAADAAGHGLSDALVDNGD